MMLQLFRKQKKKELTFERTYTAPIAEVWRAWTDPDELRQWWGPPKTTVPECEVDLRVGGRIHIVMEAGEAMGRYAGTRWPMEGTFTHIEEPHRLVYDARSWTAGEEDSTTIEHVTELQLREDGGGTAVDLRITLHRIGSGARMAAFGMKWGYKAQLDELDAFLAR